jgi:hypothetical protein
MNTKRAPQDRKALVLWAKSEKKATRANGFREISDYTKRLQYFDLQRELDFIDLLDLIAEVEKRILSQPLANENQWNYHSCQQASQVVAQNQPLKQRGNS